MDKIYNKIQSLVNLVEKGLNVHEFIIASTKEELEMAVGKFGHVCSIRVDNKFVSKDLPFYIMKENNPTIISEIWNEYIDGYKYIVSNGLRYDDKQLYNLVVKISKNGDFTFEASDRKVPLRKMYSYPMLGCCGNICDELSEWNIFSEIYGIDRVSLRRNIYFLYEYGIYDKWLELTIYPQPVGILKEYIVFWQIVS